MDADGVEAEVLYSEVSAFRYLADMKEGQSESVRAFNDVLAAFAAPDPKRLIVSYQVPIHDIDIAMAEVRRVVGMNAKSLQLPVFPSEFGLPEYFDERYEPLFALIQETGLPICCHIGLEHQPRRPDAPRPDSQQGRHGPRHGTADRRGSRHVDHGRRLREVP